MAGEPPPGADPSRAIRQGPKVRTFSCPSCAAPLTVRGLLQTDAIACAACGSVIDLSDENLQVISTFQLRTRVQPLIPLGARGTLLGDRLEVIGYLRRKITVEGVDYEWSEYLLFNPYQGFRWLSEYNGHWTYIRSMLDRPEGTGTRLAYLGRDFQHFQTSRATVSYVIGEFFWRVEVGETAEVDDYVCPPYMVSCERSDKEITWSLGQYLEPEALRAAFALKSALPARIGVFSCQPSPYGSTPTRIYGLLGKFLIAALVVQLFFLFFSQNQVVFQQGFTYQPAAVEKSLVTDPFEITGHASNVLVHTEANVSNNWIYLSYALIDDTTGRAYDFGREISYYFGRDSDGSWSEGDPKDDAVLPAIPAGKYYLRIEPDGPVETHYSVVVKRDVPRYTFFVLSLLALSLVPLIVFWRQRSFEVQRWSESDHPMWKPSDLHSSDDD